MNRLKRHKIKSEMPETSVKEKEHDLAYYIHDRVELMHQVFSVIKAKDLKVMAPECVRNISIDDLQELCTEELLGISSKRLCAILDGAEPPTDTESSSSEQLETVSLDSISSDDEVLSQHSRKCKKHKHKKHRSKKDNKQHKCKNSAPQEENAASRAGLTVLELLELQARARAIRAQLHQDNLVSAETPDPVEETDKHDSSDEVEIKEEPPEVVEISSEDEKPRIEDLPVLPPSPSKISTTETLETTTTVTKRVNDLIITVPKAMTTRKIKLNRNKTIVTATTSQAAPTDKISEPANIIKKLKNEVVKVPDNTNKEKVESKADKSKSKKKQRKKTKTIEKDGSDHDEITLQLSDTEKMDLLDFDRRNYDNLTTSGSENSESESSDCENTKVVQKSSIEKEKAGSEKVLSVKSKIKMSNDKTKSSEDIVDIHLNEEEVQPVSDDKIDNTINLKDNQKADSQNDTLKNKNSESNVKEVENIIDAQKDNLNNIKTLERDNMAIEDVTDTNRNLQNKEKCPENIDFDIEIVTDTHTDRVNETKSSEEASLNIKDKCPDKVLSTTHNIEEQEDGEITHKEEEKTDGEIHGNNSEVVCVSDDENKSKKKRKKEKKSKKDKKNKKSKSDFREDGDQNFYKENGNEEQINKSNNTTIEADEIVIDDDTDNVAIDNDIYEILELSDDSSCYEVEGVSILSEIPTKAEIEALSARIDEETHEKSNEVANEENTEEIENISWRDRYLDSKKVKKVLTTANILNAIRKKNKELKKKLEESKGEEEMPEESTKNDEAEPITSDIVEGSIDHFNTLQGSAKYVDPVEENNENGEKVTKEIEVDAKRLLKMYKRLLKHNNMYKEKDKDPNKKKKKKKQKKNKEKKGENSEKSV